RDIQHTPSQCHPTPRVSHLCRLSITPSTENEAEPALVNDLTTVLVKTLRALGQAGQPDQALPLAASAWSRLRVEHPEQAERVNGTMHYLARRPESAPVTGSRSADDSAPNSWVTDERATGRQTHGQR